MEIDESGIVQEFEELIEGHYVDNPPSDITLTAVQDQPIKMKIVGPDDKQDERKEYKVTNRATQDIEILHSIFEELVNGVPSRIELENMIGDLATVRSHMEENEKDEEEAAS